MNSRRGPWPQPQVLPSMRVGAVAELTVAALVSGRRALPGC